MDATFATTSSVYRPANEDNLFVYYSADEIATSGSPYGFFYDMGSDGAGTDYPIYWDVNLNQSRAKEIVQLLVEGQYFDDLTETIHFTTITVNRDQPAQLVTGLSIDVERTQNGVLMFDSSIQLIDTVPFTTEESLSTRCASASRLAFASCSCT